MNIDLVVNTLKNNRFKIMDMLSDGYDWATINDIFLTIAKSDPDVDIVKLLITGKNDDCQQSTIWSQSNTSLQWLPSQELIDGLINIAVTLNVTIIDELYSPQGLVSALIKQKTNKFNIMCADTFQQIETSCKLDLINISKRTAKDYEYYDKIMETIPEMVICTDYVAIDDFSKYGYGSYYNAEMVKLIDSNRHNIIVILASITFTEIYDYINYHKYYVDNYVINSYHVKAIDKHFLVNESIKIQYPSGMMAHIFIKKQIYTDCGQNINDIFSNAFLPVNEIDTNVTFAKMYYIIDNYLSNLFVANLLNENKTDKQFHLMMKKVSRIGSILDKHSKNIIFCKHLHDLSELEFWIECIENNVYLHFESRLKFFNFYYNFIDKERKNVPSFIRSSYEIVKFLYMKYINDGVLVDQSKDVIHTCMESLNNSNKTLIIKSR